MYPCLLGSEDRPVSTAHAAPAKSLFNQGQDSVLANMFQEDKADHHSLGISLATPCFTLLLE